MMLKKKILLLVFLSNLQNVLLIKNKWEQSTAQVLYKLANFAVETRRTHKYRPHYYYPQRPPNPQTIIDVLYTISQNDKLRCVPRLLCEVTSNAISTRRQSFAVPTIPVNLESLLGLLASVDIEGGSPIPIFGKAVLLGYFSKGNTKLCLDAYPTCPSDPDNLVQYLNNYNGGFFRFFNGVQAQAQKSSTIVEQRIQNQPVEYIFPMKNKLIFPSEDDNNGNFHLRKPKELPFSINYYYRDGSDIQRPLRKHKSTPMTFPDRTGTGDLRLDAEEINENYKQSHYNLQNNKLISFSPLPTNEGFYYGYENARGDVSDDTALFSFPI